MATKEVMEQMKEKLSSLAEEVVASFNGRLDYSLESIEVVEFVLGCIHDEYMETRSEEGMTGIALEFGAYIVKVIERHYGPAEWQTDDPTFGPNTFPLAWQGGQIYPVNWCTKRIFDGPGDNVWVKFQTIVMKHEPVFKFPKDASESTVEMRKNIEMVSQQKRSIKSDDASKKGQGFFKRAFSFLRGQ
ncbi:MAG: hypothetical protein WCI27_10440 [Candidatus Omnitrophota bacterium]